MKEVEEEVSDGVVFGIEKRKKKEKKYLVRVHCYGLDVPVGAKQALEHGRQRPPEQREADDEDGVRKRRNGRAAAAGFPSTLV